MEWKKWKTSCVKRNMYKSIFIGIDGSPHSEYVQDAALLLVENTKKACIQACHIYTVGLHRMRFNEMEPGLPEQYQDEERLDILRKTHDDLIVNGPLTIRSSCVFRKMSSRS